MLSQSNHIYFIGAYRSGFYNMITLNIWVYPGITHSLYVNQHETVEMVKLRLIDFYSSSMDGMRMIYKSRHMTNDEHRLSDLGVQNEGKLNLLRVYR